MAVIHWDPTGEFNVLRGDVNRLFDRMFTGSGPEAGQGQARVWAPAMDLVETAERYVLSADLPGMDESDIEIEVQDATLRIAGERTRPGLEGELQRGERPHGRFARTVSLPRGIDVDDIRATFERGVLELSIPKPQERKPRRIPVGVAGADRRDIVEGSEARSDQGDRELAHA